MVEQNLSAKDIKAIGRARYGRTASMCWFWVVMLLGTLFLVGGVFLTDHLDTPWVYTLPSGESVEWVDRDLIVDETTVVELDTPRPNWNHGFAVMLAGVGLLLGFAFHQEIRIRRAAKYTLAEWLAAGYRPKSD